MKQNAPAIFQNWFLSRGWALFPHQSEMLDKARCGESALLIAPTGGGKTLAGFLPSLIDLYENPRKGLHTLYISPLKALTQDIYRNVLKPVEEMDLDIKCETRTGDTPAAKRQRQRRTPPQILMTTPESLALMLSYPESAELFAGLQSVIIDELHALAGTKRGELLSLGLARLRTLAPDCRFNGLSATVADKESLQDYLFGNAAIVHGTSPVQPDIQILPTQARLPWSGHMATHAYPEIYELIRAHDHVLVFVNTRAQAEIIFQELWRRNTDNLEIALHHGSLDAQARRRVENAMAEGKLRAVIATSSLDLGIDWGDIDLVVQIGAPKGAARLLQRIGRANHRFGEPSRARLVPANRLEVLECEAALEAIRHGWLDGETRCRGGLDVLAQHIWGMACAAPFSPDAVYQEVVRAAPYSDLARSDFDRVLNFVATGGTALKGYEEYHKLKHRTDGLFELAHPVKARQYRMNVGTIVEASKYRLKFKSGRNLGEVEEYFILGLEKGDTFVFAGQLLEFDHIEQNTVIVRKAKGTTEPKIPAYAGGRLPLSTPLAEQVRAMLGSPLSWEHLPAQTREWLEHQRQCSALPAPAGMLVETFPRGRAKQRRYYTVAYMFEGRNAHQTMGMLLTRRMERMGLKPLGFVANDYVLAAWSMDMPADDQVYTLFSPDILGEELEEWMSESAMLKRIFHQVAVVAGLIQRRHPGHEKTAKQSMVNSDLIYDVLRRYEPDHVLLQATRDQAAKSLTDIERLSRFLNAVQGKITLSRLEKISPLAVPILLEVGKEPVWQQGAAREALFEELSRDALGDKLISEALNEKA